MRMSRSVFHPLTSYLASSLALPRHSLKVHWRCFSIVEYPWRGASSLNSDPSETFSSRPLHPFFVSIVFGSRGRRNNYRNSAITRFYYCCVPYKQDLSISRRRRERERIEPSLDPVIEWALRPEKSFVSSPVKPGYTDSLHYYDGSIMEKG